MVLLHDKQITCSLMMYSSSMAYNNLTTDENFQLMPLLIVKIHDEIFIVKTLPPSRGHKDTTPFYLSHITRRHSLVMFQVKRSVTRVIKLYTILR